jgi:hypothetical protein
MINFLCNETSSHNSFTPLYFFLCLMKTPSTSPVSVCPYSFWVHRILYYNFHLFLQPLIKLHIFCRSVPCRESNPSPTISIVEHRNCSLAECVYWHKFLSFQTSLQNFPSRWKRSPVWNYTVMSWDSERDGENSWVKLASSVAMQRQPAVWPTGEPEVNRTWARN